MKTLKSGLIVLVVIAFLVGAYFATNPGRQSSSSAKNSPNIKLSSLNQIVNTDSSSNQTSNNAAYNFNDKNNLTKVIGENVFNKIKEQEETNSDFSLPSLDVNAVSRQIAADSLKSFKEDQLNFGKITIDDKDLKISYDNSPQGKGQYLQATAEIIQKNSNDLYGNPMKAVSDAVNSGDISKIKFLADTYRAIFSAFLNTPVPSDWIGIHKEYLVLLKKSESVYQGIADFQNDPVKAYLLIQVASENLKTEAEIKNQYYQKTL